MDRPFLTLKNLLKYQRNAQKVKVTQEFFLRRDGRFRLSWSRASRRHALVRRAARAPAHCASARRRVRTLRALRQADPACTKGRRARSAANDTSATKAPPASDR